MRAWRRHSEGQALVIGVLALLILTIAVLSTINIGHAINERVRLQNTSDAAAYSMAAMEARAFNFYAFSNRTQVSQYVGAMLWQSLLSFMYWGEAFLVDVFGVLRTLDPCAFNPGIPMNIVCGVISFIFPAFSVLGQIITIYRTFLTGMVLPYIRAANLDQYIGRYVIPAYRFANAMQAVASEAVLTATLSHVTLASSDIIAANDPSITATSQRLVSGFMSACMLNRAHDRWAMGVGNGNPVPNPFRALNPQRIVEGNKVARAKRVMGGIANATRFSCDADDPDCTDGWITRRKPKDLLNIPISKISAEAKAFIDFLDDHKWGQTKLTSYRYSQGFRARNANGGNFIRDWDDQPNRPVGMLAQGDAMASDDLYEIKLGDEEYFTARNPLSCKKEDDPNECWGDPAHGRWDTPSRDLPFRAMTETSIWAMSNAEVPGGIHWRLVYPLRSGSTLYPPEAPWRMRPLGYPHPNDTEAFIGLSKIKKSFGIDIDVWVANTRMVFDRNHRWEGIVPFPHFEPGQFASACPTAETADPNWAATRRDTQGGRQEEFNQPSTWVILNKTAPQMDNLGDPTGAGNVRPSMLNMNKALSFQFQAPTRLVFDDTRAEFMNARGLNVLSRGQAYYHRPGNWAEMPNFFNPYWRPRLAPVWQAYTQFPYAEQVRDQMPTSRMKRDMQKLLTH